MASADWNVYITVKGKGGAMQRWAHAGTLIDPSADSSHMIVANYVQQVKVR